MGDLMKVAEKLKEHGDDRIGDKDKYYTDLAKLQASNEASHRNANKRRHNESVSHTNKFSKSKH